MGNSAFTCIMQKWQHHMLQKVIFIQPFLQWVCYAFCKVAKWLELHMYTQASRIAPIVLWSNTYSKWKLQYVLNSAGGSNQVCLPTLTRHSANLPYIPYPAKYKTQSYLHLQSFPGIFACYALCYNSKGSTTIQSELHVQMIKIKSILDISWLNQIKMATTGLHIYDFMKHAIISQPEEWIDFTYLLCYVDNITQPYCS